MQRINKIVPLLVFLLGIWYFCIRILGYNFIYIPGDLGDSRFINYLLEHGYQWITGKVASFWNAGFMYPFQNAIALSDSMLGTAPMYSVWRILGFSPETAYQLWWISICTFNYWISYWVFKRWFNRSEIATLLAWIFAFSIFNIGHLNYMQMIIRFMVPVVFYAACKMVNTPSIKYLIIFCFGITFQFYCAMNTGFYLLYFSIIFIIVFCFVSKNWKKLLYYLKKEEIIKTSLVFLVSFLAMLWLFLPYIKMSKIVGMNPYSQVLPNIPYLKSYLFPHESSVTWSFLFPVARPDVPAWWLHYLFPGIIPFMVMVISPLYLFYNKYKKNKIPLILQSIIITSIIIILFHIRTKNGISLYPVLFHLPGFNSIRVLIRFMHVEIFILLLILGYFLLKINGKYILLFILFVFADNLFLPERIPRVQKSELIKQKEIVMNEIVKYDYKKYEAVALINSTEVAYITNLDMMLTAQSLGLNTINGYSSNCPKGLIEFSKQNNEEGLEIWLKSRNINKDKILLLNISDNSGEYIQNIDGTINSADKYKCDTNKSMTEILCDAETLDESGNYLTTREGVIFHNGNTQSEEQCLSGINSSKLTIENPYGMTAILNKVDHGEHYLISCWRYNNGNKNACLVISAFNSSEYYNSNNKVAETRGNWQKIETEFIITDNLHGKNFKIYCYNPDQILPAYFDDLKIIMYK